MRCFSVMLQMDLVIKSFSMLLIMNIHDVKSKLPAVKLSENHTLAVEPTQGCFAVLKN